MCCFHQIPYQHKTARFVVLLTGLSFWFWLSSGVVQAQVCDGVITILRSAVEQCSELNENWACYGNITTTASPGDIRFFEPRDRQPMSVLNLVETTAEGAALMYPHFRGDIYPIRVIIFGDANMRAQGEATFALTTDGNAFLCDDTPPGLVVQTKDGETGTIEVNGTEIDLESTAFVTVLGNNEMVVVNLEGNVRVSIPALGIQLVLPVGQQVAITLSNGVPIAVGPITPSPYASSAALRWLTDSPQGLQRVTDPNREPHPVIPACGGMITFGQTLTAANFTPGQECIYRFCANRGDVITVNMDAISGTLNPWIDVRRPDDHLLIFNNDRDDADFNSQICNAGMPETSCDYMIVARPNHNASLGSFHLTLDRLTTCEPSPSQCVEIEATGLSLPTKDGSAPVTQSLPSVQLCEPQTTPKSGLTGRSCDVVGPNGEPLCDRSSGSGDDNQEAEKLPPKIGPFSGP